METRGPSEGRTATRTAPGIEVIPVPKDYDGHTLIEYLPICSECGILHPMSGYYYTKVGAGRAGVRHLQRKHSIIPVSLEKETPDAPTDEERNRPATPWIPQY